LAPLTAVRVLHELFYDYLVILGLSGSIFTVQLMALAALVPALIVGAIYGGMSGLAAAPVAVAVVVTSPLYLRAMKRANVSLRSLAVRLFRPFMVAVAAGIACTLLSHSVRSPVEAVLLSTGVGVLAMGLTLAFGRRDIADVRRWGRGRTPEEAWS